MTGVTPLDPVTAQQPCVFCRREISRLGIIIDANVRMCPRCARQVREVIDQGLAVFEGRRE